MTKRINPPKSLHPSSQVLQTITEPYKWDLPTVLNTNARSLSNKLDELDLVLQANNVGIAGISETWCTSDMPDEALAINGYNIVRRDREFRRGGGVMCYVRSDIPFKTWPALQSEQETIWITARPSKLPRQFSTLLIGTLYHPPNANNRDMLSHLTTSIDTILKDHPYAGILLMGDFNSLKDNSLKGAYNLKQIVQKPTRGSKVLDKVLTNMSSLYDTPTVSNPLGAADHNIVTCQPLPAYLTSVPKPQPVLARSSGKNQKALLADSVIKADWRPLYEMDSCEEKLDYFQSTLTSMLDLHM